MTVVNEGKPIMAPHKDARNVRELDAVLAENYGVAKLIAPSGVELELPHSVYSVLKGVIHQMALGNAIRVLPVHAELSTGQAASYLNVSRPHIVKLLEQGEIEFNKVGTHRRVLLEDLYVYKTQRDSERERLLDEIANESQELGLYDDEGDE